MLWSRPPQADGQSMRGVNLQSHALPAPGGAGQSMAPENPNSQVGSADPTSLTHPPTTGIAGIAVSAVGHSHPNDRPVTAPEIQELRSVGSSGVLRTLLERRLVRIAGRKPVVGKPFLYRTTREFLMHFGLQSLDDLPPLEEFEELVGEAEPAREEGEE